MKQLRNKPLSTLLMIFMLLSISSCYKMCGKPGEKNNTETTVSDNESKDSDDRNSGEKTVEEKIEREASESSAFTYSPPAPVNGKLKGVVELGASGFNSFIINVDADKHWALKQAKFGDSFVYDRMANETDIKDGIKKYIADMLNFGVKGSDIHFVVSSGALKESKVNKIIASLKAIGYVANTVTPEQEGIFAAKVAMPSEFTGNSFVVDMGSGNTKISWVENGKITSFESYGAKYYDKNISDDQVYNEVKKIAEKIPSNKRIKCFIIGGAPYDMAKQVRKEKERYTVLLAPNEYHSEAAKMKSGINIYKAIADGTNCDTFVFDWDSNFTIGFLLDTK